MNLFDGEVRDGVLGPARKSVDRDQSVDSEMRRTPTPTPSEGRIPCRMLKLTVESVEKPVTHVLVRESASPVKRTSAKARRSPAKKPVKVEVTLDSSNYEFSKDYSEEERAYQELKGRNGAHRASIAIKETHYEEDEEDDDDDEEEDEEEEEQEEEPEEEDDEEEVEGDYYDDYTFDDEEGLLQEKRSKTSSPLHISQSCHAAKTPCSSFTFSSTISSPQLIMQSLLS